MLRSRPQCLRCFLLSLAVMRKRALESRLVHFAFRLSFPLNELALFSAVFQQVCTRSHRPCDRQQSWNGCWHYHRHYLGRHNCSVRTSSSQRTRRSKGESIIQTSSLDKARRKHRIVKPCSRRTAFGGAAGVRRQEKIGKASIVQSFSAAAWKLTPLY